MRRRTSIFAIDCARWCRPAWGQFIANTRRCSEREAQREEHRGRRFPRLAVKLVTAVEAQRPDRGEIAEPDAGAVAQVVELQIAGVEPDVPDVRKQRARERAEDREAIL